MIQLWSSLQFFPLDHPLLRLPWNFSLLISFYNQFCIYNHLNTFTHYLIWLPNAYVLEVKKIMIIGDNIVPRKERVMAMDEIFEWSNPDFLSSFFPSHPLLRRTLKFRSSNQSCKADEIVYWHQIMTVASLAETVFLNSIFLFVI